ncbi:unnamed protein product, partial [Rotaria magnacalcarata]
MINSTIGKKLHPTKKKTKNSQLDHIEGTGENDQIEKKDMFLLQMDPVHPSLPAPPNDTPSLPATSNEKTIITSK